MRLVLCFCLLLATGCISRPFMDVPDDEFRTLGGANPQARNIVTISRVSVCRYNDYVKFKQEGSVFREERRGRWLYFAVRKLKPVNEKPKTDGQLGAEMRIWVSQRFKTRLPEETE